MERGDMVPIYRLQCTDGMFYYAYQADAKIMVICDGHVMLRFKGRAPFIESIRNIEKWKSHHEGLSK